MKKIHFASALALLTAAACSQSDDGAKSGAEKPTSSEKFAVIIAGTTVGHVKVDHDVDKTTIDYDFKNNGRGPTFAETVSFDAQGIPVSWSIAGTTSFGNAVEESYSLTGTSAAWTDATGSGAADVNEPTLYITQFGSPYTAFIYARALLNNSDRTMPPCPLGSCALKKSKH